MANYISHIATVEIPVTNLNKSIDFYVEILGVDVEFQADKQAILTFTAKGAPALFLVETETKQRLEFTNTNNGVLHSIIDFYTPNLEGFYNYLVEKKVEVGPLNMDESNHVGGFGFKDPDGNSLGVCNILQKNQ